MVNFNMAWECEEVKKYRDNKNLRWLIAGAKYIVDILSN